MEFSIEQIAKACNGKLVLQGTHTDRSEQVTGVVLDSRQVTEGSVFIATVGERVDGHRFIQEVFAKGASLVITQKTPEQVTREMNLEKKVIWGSYLLVEDSFQALKELAEAYRKTLQIPIIGITGSVGKTSTKEFIAGALSARFRVLKTEGNFNNEVGVPLTLLRIRKDHEIAVVEMGISNFGEMHRLSRMVRPNVCVITNIGKCHLENLGTRDGILKAKSEIFDFMAADGQVCLNGEDDKLAAVTKVHDKKTIFFGLGNHAGEEVYASDIVSKGLWGSEAILHTPTGVFPVKVPLPGQHMVMNAAAAACVAALFGLTEEEITRGIAGVSAIGGRNHLIDACKYTLIDDCYNANPVSMEAAIDLLKLADTPKAAILGDMFELGADSDSMHAQVGTYAALAGIDRLLCVGEHSKYMYEAACRAAGEHTKVQYFPDREMLLQTIRQDGHALLPEGYTILIKASHGMNFTEVVNILSCS